MDIWRYKYPCPGHSKGIHERASQDHSGKRRFERERLCIQRSSRAAPPREEEGEEEGEEEEELEIARVLIQKEIQPSVYRFCHGSVDTPPTGVDTMLQTQVLDSVSTQPEVVSTLVTLPREPILPVLDSASTKEQAKTIMEKGDLSGKGFASRGAAERLPEGKKKEKKKEKKRRSSRLLEIFWACPNFEDEIVLRGVECEEEGRAWCPGVVEIVWSEDEVANQREGPYWGSFFVKGRDKVAFTTPCPVSTTAIAVPFPVAMFLLLWPVRDCVTLGTPGEGPGGVRLPCKFRVRAAVVCSYCCIACMESVVIRCVHAVAARLVLDSLDVVFLVWRTLAGKSSLVLTGCKLCEGFSQGCSGLVSIVVVLPQSLRLCILVKVLPRIALCRFCQRFFPRVLCVRPVLALLVEVLPKAALFSGVSSIAIGNCVLCRALLVTEPVLTSLGTCGVVVPFGRLPVLWWHECMWFLDLVVCPESEVVLLVGHRPCRGTGNPYWALFTRLTPLLPSARGSSSRELGVGQVAEAAVAPCVVSSSESECCEFL
ncbi:hypothetical protein Taro_036075 [Colocasia esculenta]|uniref:Uncharacterized protein n=1 Tax=Colocasia esculenta TaxID=4460 RepID=A0A843W5P7_COLES|nr:hypothetical protein [Colocasia esculenta]